MLTPIAAQLEGFCSGCAGVQLWPTFLETRNNLLVLALVTYAAKLLTIPARARALSN
jgi:hypothetical protein